MKKLGYLILGYLLLMPSMVFSQTKRVEAISDVQGIDNLENILPNPSFDRNSTGWTATGFVASAATTGANLGRGPRSLVVDMDTTGDLIETASITIPNYMQGQLGIGWCRFRNPNTTGGSTTDYQLRITDGSTPLTDISVTNLIPQTSTYQRHSQNFTFPASGVVRLQIRAMSATVSEMAVDDCYLGLSDLGQHYAGAVSTRNLLTAERIERAHVGVKCTSTPCTITASTAGIASVTRTSGGAYNVNFVASTFSAVPSCVVSGYDLSATGGFCGMEGTSTTSLQSVGCRSYAGVLGDDAFAIICMGVR